MAPRTVYPRSAADCVRLLLTLGFVKKDGIGRGKHPEKYQHPTRKNIVEGDRPFIIIPHEYFDQLGMKVMKKAQNWGFSKDEVEAALNGIRPSEVAASLQTDAELEES